MNTDDVDVPAEVRGNHLCPQSICPAGEAYCKMRVVEAESFLLDPDRSQIQCICLVELALRFKCRHDGKCGGVERAGKYNSFQYSPNSQISTRCTAK